MRCIVYLFLALLSVDSFADAAYDKALQTGVYEFENSDFEFKYFPEKLSFDQLHKNEGVTYERHPSSLLHVRTQSVLAERLNQYLQNKKIKIHTVTYETNTLKYKAVYESDAISVTATYKENNQEHSKIWFYKPFMLPVSYALEKNQSIKMYWPSGKLQSQEYFCSGVPVGYAKYFNVDGKLHGVIDWTQSDYEQPTNKMYKSVYQMTTILLAGSIYFSDGKSLVLAEKLSTLGPNVRRPLSLSELDAIPFAETYQRHKLGMQHMRPIDKNTEKVLKCPWLDEAMSYSNENPQFALPIPKPITTADVESNPRDLYDECIASPNVDCLSHFTFEQTKNDSNANSFYTAHRIFTALERKDELNQTLQIMRQRGMSPFGADFEKKVNKQTDVFKKERTQAQEEIRQAEIAKNNVLLIKTLRKPVYIEPLNVDLSKVGEVGGYGADRQVYLMALAAAAEAYADKNQSNKAKELLSFLELNMPKLKKLKGTDSDRQIINNIRAEMAIAYSRLGMADLAEVQLTQIEYAEQPIIHGTYFAAYGWINSSLQLCKNGNLQKGRDFLSNGISMQKNNRLQIAETLKLAIDECKYPFDLKRVVGSNYNNPYAREVFAGYPQMWLNYELHYKGSLPAQPIDFIEKQRKELEAKDGTNKDWIYQNYYSQKINTLFASGRVIEAKKVANEYERFVQAGSWYKFAPTIYTKVGRTRAKYSDCKGALNSFSNAVKSLQLNKMNVDNSFVIRHPHYTVLPLISQGMAYCGASVDDIQKLQIDFDYSVPAETIQNSRRADALEIEIAINKSRSDAKTAIELINKLAPTDLKVNALVTIAKQSTRNKMTAKAALLRELNSLDQYFIIQHGAKEQRRAIGGFLDVLDLYFVPSDKRLPIHLTDLGKHVEMIPQAQFKARAMCHLGYMADKKQVNLDKDYFNLGVKVSKDLSWAYGSPAGSCAYWLKKAVRIKDAESLLDNNMATFRAYKIAPNDPNNWRKYAEGRDLANAAFVYWEYENGEMPSKYDEILNYYQDSTGLIEAY